MKRDCPDCGKEMRKMTKEEIDQHRKEHGLVSNPYYVNIWDPQRFVGSGYGTMLRSEYEKRYSGIPVIVAIPYMCECGYKQSYRE